MLKKSLQHVLLYLVLILCIGLYSCSDRPSAVNEILESTSNKSELEKVISHYKQTGDEQKLKAIYFIIRNLSYQHHFEGEGVNQYRQMFQLIKPDYTGRGLHRTWDSLKVGFGTNFPGPVHRVDDVNMLKAAYLIKHIDAAFIAWRYPWAKNLSFDDFCKYLLPYKLVNEEPDNWCSILQIKNQWLLDSIDQNKDVYDACLMLNKALKRQFNFDTFPPLWDINYSNLDILKAGSCYHATQYAAYNMRAMGIPVVMDFTPFWGNRNGGHEWNALIFNGKPIPFVGGESDPGKTKIDLSFQRKRGKVFRYSFATQPNDVVKQSKDKVSPYLKAHNIEDVTRDYIPVTDISVTLNNIFPDAEYAYISVFNRQVWTPLYWGNINSDKKAVFRDMGRSIVYLPMYYEAGEFVPAGDPIVLESDGTAATLHPDRQKKTNLVITQKSPEGPNVEKGKDFELFYWDDKWLSLGKKIASSNTIVFENVPQNALYWIHSKNKSTKERIFTYKNNKLKWW